MNPFITRSGPSFRTFLILHLMFSPTQITLVSYRMTKDHVIFHSTMHPRKGNSCSYLVEFNSNGMTVYGKVVCYIVRENVACALLEERKKTGRNVSQDLQVYLKRQF